MPPIALGRWRPLRLLVAVVAGSAALLAAPASTGAADVGAAAPARAMSLPLRGYVVGIDPGHNGRNWAHPDYLGQQVWNGRSWEDCDTTGTATQSGYPEPKFAWRVARFLRHDLRELGAVVVMTRDSNTGHGPCVDRRAEILNRAGSDVAIDLHADGGPSNGRGFTVLLPVGDPPGRHLVRASVKLGHHVRRALVNHTAMPISDYYGSDGFARRSDLAGLNLARQPKVLVECGNMRNRADARKLKSDRFQHRLARALAIAVRRSLAAR
jgi:N-acetylmuramoyl-L-alanine amidase